MDFYAGVHEDRGEEMGLEQEGATDPAKAQSAGRNRSGESTICEPRPCVSFAKPSSRPALVRSSTELLERANVSAIVRRLLDQRGSIAVAHRKKCEAIRPQ